MSKIKLYKNSPLNVLGGRLQNVLRYQDIAKAGAPQSLTGRAVMELGRLFTQMDMDEDGETKEEDPKNQRTDLERLQLFNDGKGLDYSDTTKSYLKPKKLPELSKLNPRPPVLPIPTPDEEIVNTETVEKFGNKYLVSDAIPTVQTRTAGSSTLDPDVEGVEGYDMSSYFDQAVLDAKPGQAFYVEGVSGVKDPKALAEFTEFYNADGTRKTATLETPNKRLSPINRLNLQALDSDTVNLLEGLRYRRKGADNSPLHRAAHVSMSPFLDTESDSKIDYRYMKRATTPDYFAKTDGLAGSAAAGYNLVVDKANYNAAVKKDYEEEVTDAMGSLDVAPDLVKNDFTKDYFNLAAEYKAEYAGYHKQYANGDMTKIELEARKTNMSTKLSQVADAGKNLQTLRSEYLKDKSQYDIDASDTQMVDFYNTLEHEPSNLSVKQIDGVTYMVGKTKQGKDIKVPASKIADGTAGFRLVEKVDLTPLVTDALGAIQEYTEEGATKYGTGVKNADPVKSKKIAMASIMASLRGDENNLRSLMSQVYGVDHDTYQNFLGDDPKDNRQEILQDAAEHLYETQVKPQYFPKSKTTRFAGSNNGKSSVSERNRAANVARLQKIGDITPGNFNSIESEIDLTKYSLTEDKGVYYVTDKKGNVLTQLNLSDQQDTKSKLLNFMKGGGGVGQKSNQTESDPLGIN